MMTINIGCGSDTWGNIRLDYAKKPKEYYLTGESSVNLIADAQHLPFMNKCFSELRASHVLEHIRNWKKALKEWCRVSVKVRIKVPTNSNSAIIFVKSLLQNINLYQISLIPKNFKSMLRLKEQCNEHLWQIEPKGVVKMIKVYGLAHSIVKKINVPILYMKIPILKFGVKTEKFKISHSWNITAW